MASFGGIDSDIEDGFRCLKEIYCVLCSRNGARKDVCVVYKLSRGLVKEVSVRIT